MEQIVKRLHENRLRESNNVKLRHIIDTWNMIEKYGIESYEDHDSYVSISKEDYEKMLNQAKNKSYIRNLRLGESKSHWESPAEYARYFLQHPEIDVDSTLKRDGKDDVFIVRVLDLMDEYEE